MWIVPKGLLPIKNPQENDWKYYVKLNEWKQKNKMPDDVFVYVIDRTEFLYGDPEVKKKVGFDHSKPQYISFKNPLLVNLFAKISTKVPDYMRIVEMSPAPEQILQISEKPYVTECILQWYT